VQVTFTIRRETYPPVAQRIFQAEDAKYYLELHLDRRLNWRLNIYLSRENNLSTTRENILATRQRITTVN